ncbi:heat shock protein HslJ [Novosphingobium sp. PhB165]|uniref:META domain-containing protein n=1 Tax=Novosphingobium sp. PhB165 TaxID=2485105 RepID=UPI0010431B3D|nr:META domain-containing protein [Novosphingobium sp. PhB165]TCM21855.1 heat shock protein HslJ [Novosphingobium sp. PhB165]
MVRHALLPVFCAASLAACSGGGGGDSQLSRSTWRFTLIDGQHPQTDGARITFEGRKIGVRVGCNQMDGPWRVDDDRLVAGPLALTEMSCPTPAWDQEKAIGALLVATPRFTVDRNRMILQSSGHTAELQRETSVAGNDKLPGTGS